jgi:hypothetical protein
VIAAACSVASAALAQQLATAVAKEHERALNHQAAIVGGSTA